VSIVEVLVDFTADFDLFCGRTTIVEVEIFVPIKESSLSVVFSGVRSGTEENATDADLLVCCITELDCCFLLASATPIGDLDLL